MPHRYLSRERSRRSRSPPVTETRRNTNVHCRSTNLLVGAPKYTEYCSVCHGAPLATSTAIAKGMFPPPPQLFEELVTNDPEGITFWKVTNGIRMTGLPAFQKTLSDTERWQATMLLARADRLPAGVMASLTP